MIIIKCVRQVFLAMMITGISSLQTFAGDIPAKEENDFFTKGILSNGMTLIVARDNSMPRVTMMTAVKAGSIDEPVNATGLAHYLEHMLFKGTDRISALNYAGEAPLLEKITELYEARRQSPDPAEQERIYLTIDKLSGEAAEFSCADEYTSLLQSIGAADINAFTSYDVTAYHCDIPVNALEKFFILEAERFSSPVFRRFHTELETVYEEFNRMQDSDERRFVNAAMQSVFSGTPYARPIIGQPDDLKFPSLLELQNFYRRAYTPGNMILIAAGDVEYEQVRELAEKHFCSRLPAVDAEPLPPTTLQPFTGGGDIVVSGPGEEMVLLAYRFPNDRETVKKLTFFDAQLCYREIGRLDRLTRSGKVLSAGSYVSVFRDAAVFICHATPVEGATVDETAELLRQEINAVAAGDYPEWMPAAIADNLYYDNAKNLEKRYTAAAMLLRAEIQSTSLDMVFADFDDIRNISRDDFKEFAADTILAVRPAVVRKIKVEGTPETVRVPKPPVTPVPLNSDSTSEYAVEFASKPLPHEKEPEFIELKTVFGTAENSMGRTVKSLPNNRDKRFSIRFRWTSGNAAIPEAGTAVAYWQKLGINGDTLLSPDEVKLEWFKRGCHFSASANRDSIEIRIEGLQHNFERAMELLADAVHNPAANRETLDILIKTTLNDRNNNRTRPDSVSEALWNYAIYGKDNPVKNLISSQALQQLDAAELARLPRKLFDAPCTVMVYGLEDAEAVLELIDRYFPVPEVPVILPENKRYKTVDYPGNDILAVDFPGAQFRVSRIRKGGRFDTGKILYEDIYNDFIYRTAYNYLREARALGYVAGSYIVKPAYAWQEALVVTRVDCQADKLAEAMEAVCTFDNDPCTTEADFINARERYARTLATAPPVAESIFDTYIINSNRGLDHDPRREIYYSIPGCTLEDFQRFLLEDYGTKNSRFIIMGETDSIPESIKADFDLKILSIDEIFPE